MNEGSIAVALMALMTGADLEAKWQKVEGDGNMICYISYGECDSDCPDSDEIFDQSLPTQHLTVE